MTYGNRLLSRDMQPIFSNMQLPSCKIEDIPPLDLQQMSPNLQHDWGLMAIHMSPPEQQVHQSIYQEVRLNCSLCTKIKILFRYFLDSRKYIEFYKNAVLSPKGQEHIQAKTRKNV